VQKAWDRALARSSKAPSFRTFDWALHSMGQIKQVRKRTVTRVSSLKTMNGSTKIWGMSTSIFKNSMTRLLTYCEFKELKTFC